MQEPIRLVIWDLDETFWKGTLAEDGAIDYSDVHHDIVVELSRRGILNSVCSKNDHDKVKEILEKHGLWDYFIFPSINWEPKGIRLKNIVDASQLRPETILFIDDNPGNLREAEYYVPRLQTATEEIIPQLLSHKLFVGKDDRELTRLRQYKLLEMKAIEATAASSNLEFLRSSDIQVHIDYDLSANIDRAVELINRTNQLNFTKSRLPEDRAEAAKTLTALTSRFDIQAGLVRVSDKYGDYGYVGLFVMRNFNNRKTLIHFCFSCRTLNMGIEAWVYKSLGSPDLKVVGEVVSDPIAECDGVDWINLRADASTDGAKADQAKIDSVFVRGGCELSPLEHYFRLAAKDVAAEFNFARDNFMIRIEHSVIMAHAVKGIDGSDMNLARSIGYQPEDFETALLTKRWSAVLLAFWNDWSFSVFRHRQSGTRFSFGWHGPGPARSLENYDEAAIQGWFPQKWVQDGIRTLHEEFDFEDRTSKDLYRDNLRTIFRSVPSDTPVFVLLSPESYKPARAYNRETENAAAEFANVTCLRIEDYVTSPSEVQAEVHFDRLVYYRLFLDVMNRIKSTGRSDKAREELADA